MMVRNGKGQPEGGPSGDALQSCSRIIWPIVPPPDRKRKAICIPEQVGMALNIPVNQAGMLQRITASLPPRGSGRITSRQPPAAASVLRERLAREIDRDQLTVHLAYSERVDRHARHGDALDASTTPVWQDLGDLSE